MSVIACIVEGDGEVPAVPILLRRLAEWLSPGRGIQVRTPIRVKRDRFLNKEQEFRRYLLLAAEKCEADGWILLLLDADDDCPAQLSQQIMQRAQQIVPHQRLSVVLPSREYEAWFIAAAPSLAGKRGFTFTADLPSDPDKPRNAKKWLADQMEKGYHEITDQPAFSACFDLSQAHTNSRSFRKLCSEWRKQMG